MTRSRRLLLSLLILAVGYADVLFSEERPQLRLPLSTDTTTHYYRDDNSTDAEVNPWNCNPSESYDNHSGTDYSGGPRGKPIYAAAPGWIIEKDDGHPDGCDGCTPPNGNFVRLYHGNGISTVYSHMEMGTVTSTPLYSFVECGEILGGVGKSGYVVGFDPLHLHFEAKTHASPAASFVGDSFDPYSGACSSTPNSWWVDQQQGSPSTQCTTEPWEFANGDCIQANTVVNVRETPSGPIVSTQTSGALGTVVGEPSGGTLGGVFYVWWHVRWSDGTEGWSIEDALGTGPCSTALDPPASLTQLTHAGTLLNTGQVTNAGTVQLGGVVSRGFRLDLEVRQLSESFTGEPTHAADLQITGGFASTCILNLPDSDYHWRARTTDASGNSSAWISYGNNDDSSVDFRVEATVCALCQSNSSLVLGKAQTTSAACGTPLSVVLTSNPSLGQAPLSDVDLTASVTGLASGSITYTFYCSRDDVGTDVTPSFDAQYANITINSLTVADLCTYSSQGIYSPKVVVQREGFAGQAKGSVTVSTGTSGAPSVTTQTATATSTTVSTLNMTVNPNGLSTDVWFDWGESTNLSFPPTPTRSIGSRTSSVNISETVSSLSCDTTYYFRAVATNSQGTSTGAMLSFHTASCGGTGGTHAKELLYNGGFESGESIWVADDDGDDFHIGISDSPYQGSYYSFLSESDGTWGNDLDGDLEQVVVAIPENASDLDISFWYSISTTESPTTTMDWDTLILEIQDITGGTGTTELVKLSNRNATGTGVYSFRTADVDKYIGESIFVKFVGHTDYSNPTVFRIDNVSLIAEVPDAGPPSVATGSADQISDSSVRLNMTANPNGLPTEAWFRWDDDTNLSYETDKIAIGSVGSSLGTSISLFGLDCETTYYYQSFVENAEGTANGSQRFFATSSCPGGPPSADTDSAVDITATSATMTAEIFPNQRETTAWFDLGNTLELRDRRGTTSVGNGNSWVTLTATLSSLACETTYYFRAGAQNEAGTDYGSIHSFFTASCPSALPQPTTLPADEITSSSASLHAWIDYFGLPTEGWFEWGVSSFTGESSHFAFDEEYSGATLQFDLQYLTCETTYQFRAGAQNEYGTAYGDTLYFATDACPPPSTEIFSDDFESGDLASWSLVHPRGQDGISITPAAAFSGGVGLEVIADQCLLDKTLDIFNETYFDTQSFLACNSIGLHGVHFDPGADVDLIAGDRVVFYSGSRVSNGARVAVAANRETASTRYLEDQTPLTESPYSAEFAIDASALSFDTGASIDVLTGYDSEGEALFKLTLSMDDSRGLVLDFSLRSQNYTTWIPRYGYNISGGFKLLTFFWRSNSADKSGRGILCLSEGASRGCSFQYHNLVDSVDFVRLGVVSRTGETTGNLRLDQFSSGREEDASIF